jgi:hypothetical protein
VSHDYNREKSWSSPWLGFSFDQWWHTNLQYVNDTTLHVKFTDESSITRMKFMVYCYEDMAGLKINF